MGFLSKIVLNGLEMLIKDSSATSEISRIATYINSMWNGRAGENIYYVSPLGNDTTGDGTETKPFRTIQHAYDVAVSYPMSAHNSVSLFVESGAYDENVVFGGTFLPTRVIFNMLGNVVINGSLTVRNVTCEIVAPNGNTYLSINETMASETLNFSTLVEVTEFGTLNWNARGYINGAIGAMNYAMIVAYGSKLYCGYGLAILGDYNVAFLAGIASTLFYKFGKGIVATAPADTYFDHCICVDRNLNNNDNGNITNDDDGTLEPVTLSIADTNVITQDEMR